MQVYKAKSTEVSLGVLHFFNVGDYNLGIAYGVATTGSADSFYPQIPQIYAD